MVYKTKNRLARASLFLYYFKNEKIGARYVPKSTTGFFTSHKIIIPINTSSKAPMKNKAGQGSLAQNSKIAQSIAKIKAQMNPKAKTIKTDPVNQGATEIASISKHNAPIIIAINRPPPTAIKALVNTHFIFPRPL